MPTILITDSLFLPVGGSDEQRLREAGYDIDRLDVPKADEATLIAHIAGKDGYILGGVEEVTDQVILAGDKLRAIAFTGSGYQEFIPGWEAATKAGVAISAARGENASAVAEWALVSGLTLVRDIPALTTPDGPSFSISRDFASLTLGIVGFGTIGRSLATKASALGINVIVAADSTGSTGSTGFKTAAADEVLGTADIVSVHVSKPRGVGALDRRAISNLKPGAVLVNAAFRGAVDDDALLERVRAGELRAAVDYPVDSTGLVGRLLSSNGQTAYNTAETNARVGARATSSLLNLLSKGEDADLVNPDYKNFL